MESDPSQTIFSCSYGKLQPLAKFGFVKDAMTVCDENIEDIMVDPDCNGYGMFSADAGNNATQKVVDYYN